MREGVVEIAVWDSLYGYAGFCCLLRLSSGMWGSEVIGCLFCDVKLQTGLSGVSALFMTTWIMAADPPCVGVIFLWFLWWNRTKHQPFCCDNSSECGPRVCGHGGGKHSEHVDQCLFKQTQRGSDWIRTPAERRPSLQISFHYWESNRFSLWHNMVKNTPNSSLI